MKYLFLTLWCMCTFTAPFVFDGLLLGLILTVLTLLGVAGFLFEQAIERTSDEHEDNAI